jgi:hypothetical protein
LKCGTGILVLQGGIQEMAPSSQSFEAKQFSAEVAQIIDAPLARVIPLLSPQGEYEWIPGWDYVAVHPKDKNLPMAKYGVFVEDFIPKRLYGVDVGPATWYVADVNPTARSGLLVVGTRISMKLVEAQVQALRENRTEVRYRWTVTTLNEEGNKIVGDHFDEKIETVLTALMKALKHYCEKGEKLSDWLL